MNSFILNQIYVFLIFILCGIIIGLFFDFFRILRKTFKTPDFITYIEDIIFWIVTCVLLGYTIFKYNNGELRLFIFIGLFIGIILYILIASKYIVKIFTKINITIKNFVIKIYKFIISPIRKVINLSKKLVIFVKQIIKKLVKSRI